MAAWPIARLRLGTSPVWVAVRHAALHFGSATHHSSHGVRLCMGFGFGFGFGLGFGMRCGSLQFSILFALKCSLFTWAYTHRYIDICSRPSAPSPPVSLSLVGVSARINDALHYVRERIACSTATATAAASRSPCPAPSPPPALLPCSGSNPANPLFTFASCQPEQTLEPLLCSVFAQILINTPLMCYLFVIYSYCTCVHTCTEYVHRDTL